MKRQISARKLLASLSLPLLVGYVASPLLNSLSATAGTATSAAPQPAVNKAQIDETFGKLPLSFEANGARLTRR